MLCLRGVHSSPGQACHHSIPCHEQRVVHISANGVPADESFARNYDISLHRNRNSLILRFSLLKSVANMGLRTMFPASGEKPAYQYSLGANLSKKKTGFGPFNGTQIAVSTNCCRLI